ncbi:hypothetical protein TeGR_g8549 [Tetraparma gracilis]|uniref:WSC domain-containing protein n=1 Tax=Tetraparma gracilis TaxID=2962635 RepID=A0ABQ6N5H1_9STRA|nr:hypothetical protein TeGR_g8549 [Tetraparma gracilis]
MLASPSPPLSDGHRKTALLYLAVLGCLLSLFTSPSLSLDSGAAPSLSPRAAQTCRNYGVGGEELGACLAAARAAYDKANFRCAPEIAEGARCNQFCGDEGLTGGQVLECRAGCSEANGRERDCVLGVVKARMEAAGYSKP